jgi:hypothetical protein
MGFGGIQSLEAEQREEWYALKQQAMEWLRKGNTPDRLGVRQLFKMLVLPSFEAAFSWEVCQDVKATNRYFAVRSIWHKKTDLSKLATPIVRLRYPRPLVLSIEVGQLPLEAEWVEATLIALKSLTIPAMVELEAFGCDGTFYEVAFDAGFVQARYGWWEEPPLGWRPLNLWLQQTLEALEQMTVSE